MKRNRVVLIVAVSIAVTMSQWLFVLVGVRAGSQTTLI
jgi:hypothetical protein